MSYYHKIIGATELCTSEPNMDSQEEEKRLWVGKFCPREENAFSWTASPYNDMLNLQKQVCVILDM